MTIQTLRREVWYRLEYVRRAVGLDRASPAAPHLVKRRLIQELQRQHGLQVFVETGTYLGDMVAAQAVRFREVHSIELSEELHARARARFAGRRNVQLYQGDSAAVLPLVLERCSEPTLFWLDAHYSGGITSGDPDQVPLLQELAGILNHPIRHHVILVDDARLLNGQAGYPTFDALQQFVRSARPEARIGVESDVVKIILPDTAAAKSANGREH